MTNILPWYNENALKRALGHCHTTVGGLPLLGGDFCPLRKRGGDMVTYSELFQFCLVLIGVISLIVQIIKKK